MKIKIFTTASKEAIPFNYQQFLTGALHKWLGENELHGTRAQYSFSWLQGPYVKSDKGLIFPEGASYFISSHDQGFIKSLIDGIRKLPDVCFGLKVSEIFILSEPDFNSKSDFQAISPIFCKRTIHEKEKHFTYQDQEWTALLKESLLKKMILAGLEPDNSLEIEHLKHSRSNIKVIHYKDIGNKVSFCNLKIHALPATKEFAWNVGLGNSTGVGFGAIM